MLGKHLIKSWSSTQAAISLSSGEAEFYGVVKAAGVGLGYGSLLSDVGVVLPLRVWTDSTATIGICGRQGLGKLRHIDTQCLWIQQRVRDGTVSLLKVRGEDNPADLFTKHLAVSDRIPKLLELFGCEYRGGRSQLAPALREGQGTETGELLATTKPRWYDYDDEAATDLMDWYGRPFRRALSSDGNSSLDVPEAYPLVAHLLPHQHEQLAELFPQAVACPALAGARVEEDERIEKIGWKIGVKGDSETESEEPDWRLQTEDEA